MANRLTGVKHWCFGKVLALVLFLRRFFNASTRQSEKVTQVESYDDAFESGFIYLQTTYTKKSIVFDRTGFELKWWEARSKGVRFDGFVWEENFVLSDLRGKDLLSKTKEIRLSTVVPKRKRRRVTA